MGETILMHINIESRLKELIYN